MHALCTLTHSDNDQSFGNFPFDTPSTESLSTTSSPQNWFQRISIDCVVAMSAHPQHNISTFGHRGQVVPVWCEGHCAAYVAVAVQTPVGTEVTALVAPRAQAAVAAGSCQQLPTRLLPHTEHVTVLPPLWHSACETVPALVARPRRSSFSALNITNKYNLSLPTLTSPI